MGNNTRYNRDVDNQTQTTEKNKAEELETTSFFTEKIEEIKLTE